MAAKNVYVPCYMIGADGLKAYELIKLTGTVLTGAGQTIPEGECMISSRVIQNTPPPELQPKGNQ